jgi:flagellar basal-body rod modification protein FlgD
MTTTGITNNPVSSTPTSSSSSSSATSATDKLANEQTFLQLFVSQLQNQDPLNPADGTQFVTQLAQFSQLEQTIGISQNVSAIRQQVAPAAPGATSDDSSNQNTSGTSGTAQS